MTAWLKKLRLLWRKHGDKIIITGYVVLVIFIVAWLGPKSDPKKLSELLNDTWSVSQIYKLHSRLGCQEVDQTPRNPQCEIIGKIFNQKKSAAKVVEIDEKMIENDVLIMPNGEIVGWRLTNGQVD